MKRRSPLQDAPLPLPGDSARSQLTNLAFNDLLPALALATLLSLMAFIEWQAAIHNWSRHPTAYFAIAGVSVLICVWRFRRAIPRIRDLTLGRSGEISVAALLDELRSSDTRVFHDIPSKFGNIDHVVLSRRGFYVIETKTRSKPVGRRAEVSFNGDRLSVDGFVPDRDPLEQVQRNARNLSVLLARKTKKQYQVRCVVIFPGWWVRPMDSAWIKAERPWVLNDRAAMKWLANGSLCVDAADLHLAATHLEAYLRQSNGSTHGR